MNPVFIPGIFPVYGIQTYCAPGKRLASTLQRCSFPLVPVFGTGPWIAGESTPYSCALYDIRS